MSVQEIPRQEWSAFCDSFSRQHQGWLVSLEVVSADLTLTARYLPLEKIQLYREGDKERVSLMVGELPDKYFSQTVVAPVQIKLEQTEKGAHQTLAIQAATGILTTLRFRTTALPELIDGVLDEELM